MNLANSPIPYQHFVEEHPELFHYTNKSGIKGIIISNTLWASHYQQLNDSREIVHLREPLVSAILPRCTQILRVWHPAISNDDKAIAFNATALASRFVNRLYQETYEINRPGLRPAPFVTSLCTHSKNMDYERQNGLLSQWRSYGGNDGYCIVFDTRGICDLLTREWENRLWIFLGMDRVRYTDGEIHLKDSMSDLVNSIESSIEKFFLNDTISESAITQFFAYSTLLKHEGFREEQEVRISAIPANHMMRTEGKTLGVRFIDKEIANIISTENGKRKFIPLFFNLSKALPIRRVIIGPSRNQRESYAFVQSLVGDTVEIKCSNTPWLPPVQK